MWLSYRNVLVRGANIQGTHPLWGDNVARFYSVYDGYKASLGNVYLPFQLGKGRTTLNYSLKKNYFIYFNESGKVFLIGKPNIYI